MSQRFKTARSARIDGGSFSGGAKSSVGSPASASRSSARPAQQPRICDRKKGNTLTTELGGAWSAANQDVDGEALSPRVFAGPNLLAMFL
ncbi:MAG: hypothetical protein EOR71_12835 [Mesorhizobium sp.]|nr:MAG: hypothetical protein EOR71_12835 [Mesorhizobium sp.]